jgi:hypothetical protein
MFRTLIYPSSGACDFAVELPRLFFFFLFFVGDLVRLVLSGVRVAGNTDTNSTAQSQAPGEGYINVRNMLST